MNLKVIIRLVVCVALMVLQITIFCSLASLLSNSYHVARFGDYWGIVPFLFLSGVSVITTVCSLKFFQKEYASLRIVGIVSIVLTIMFINPIFSLNVLKHAPNLIYWLSCAQLIVDPNREVIIQTAEDNPEIEIYGKDWQGKKCFLDKFFSVRSYDLFSFTKLSIDADNKDIVKYSWSGQGIRFHPVSNGETNVLISFKGQSFKIPVSVTGIPLWDDIFNSSPLKPELLLNRLSPSGQNFAVPVVFFGGANINLRDIKENLIDINGDEFGRDIVRFADHSVFKFEDVNSDGYEDAIFQLDYRKVALRNIRKKIEIKVHTRKEGIIVSDIRVDQILASEKFDRSDPVMNEAIKKAQASIPDFLGAIRYLDRSFVKVPFLLHSGETEYLWGNIWKIKSENCGWIEGQNLRTDCSFNPRNKMVVNLLRRDIPPALIGKIDDVQTFQISDLTDWLIKEPVHGNEEIKAGGFTIEAMFKKIIENGKLSDNAINAE